MSQFGDELRRLRRRSGLSQETLAGKAGLSPEAVSLLERGRRSPRLTTMRLLAEAMRLTDAERASLFTAAQVTEPSAPPLPVFIDDLVGRDGDLARIDGLLERFGGRLVTVVGPAGVGKTRVAVEYARRSPGLFPDGIHWLPAGPLADRDSLFAALAGAIGSRTSLSAPLNDLVSQLQHHALLLIIDDAEHLLPACRELAAALLTGSPRSKIMITSRHLLELPGELVCVLPPLGIPPLDSTPAQLRDFPASRLFLERAQRPDDLTPHEAQSVIRICRRIDGLPLALELAAARTRILTLAELADALESELSVLSAADRDGAALVDTMVDVSYGALTEHEKVIFARLSVFGSSFSRDAVRRVCGNGDLTEAEVTEVMSALSAKSLLDRRDDGGPHARFRLLYLIKDYAVDRLDARPDAADTHARHARYYCRSVEAAAATFGTREQPTGLAAIDRDLSNIRRAIGWAVEHEPPLALRIVAALAQWIYIRGRYTDGRAWATRALHAPADAPTTARAPVLQLAGMLAFLQCDYDEAASMMEQARQLYISVGDRRGEVWTVGRLGSVARELGDYDLAEERHQHARRLAQLVGDDHEDANQVNFLSFLTWLRGRPAEAAPLGRAALDRLDALDDRQGVIWALINLGTSARLLDDLDQAQLLLAQAYDLADELDFREGLAWAQNQLGVVARLRGESERALGLQLASRAEHSDLGDRWREASVQDELAALALGREDYVGAAQWLTAADRLRQQINAPVPAVERNDRERTEQATRAALGSAYGLVGLNGRTPH